MRENLNDTIALVKTAVGKITREQAAALGVETDAPQREE
jgi:hypothetical protein